MHRQWSGLNGVAFFAFQLFVDVSTLGIGNEGWLIAAVIVKVVTILSNYKHKDLEYHNRQSNNLLKILVFTVSPLG